MRRVQVSSYEVEIGSDFLFSPPKDGSEARSGLAARLLRLAPKSRSFVVLTDEGVAQHYLPRLREALQDLPFPVHFKTIPQGERSKSRLVKSEVEDWMLERRCGRDTCLVCVGGGVVGDLGGFIAASFMRGIPFVQVPTSFLAMVDSSVGGKTGIDVGAGKNLVGAFHRPLAVLEDVSVLQTLPLRHLVNGLAESVKAGAIRSLPLFELIESHVAEILAYDQATLVEVIHQSVAIKAEVVAADEFEGGVRAILNFGHTIGHAVEALMQPMLLHGECVSIGMRLEAEVARTLGLLTSGDLRRLVGLCHALGLPVELPPSLRDSDLVDKMRFDKKNRGQNIKIIMLTELGRATHPAHTVEPDFCAPFLRSWAALQPGLTARGSVAVPGSKSISNRVLAMAALGSGRCRINNLLFSEDTHVMIAALRKLGVDVAFEPRDENGHVPVTVSGNGGKLDASQADSLYLGNAGTASRFLTTMCVLCPAGQQVELTGNRRLQVRPVGDLVDALLNSQQCASIEYVSKQGSLPIRITTSSFRGGEIQLAAGVSSQFVSSILISAPYAAVEPITLRLARDGLVVSPLYIDMTVRLMERFGVVVERPDDHTFVIPRGGYTNPSEIDVEGDASSATYPLALAAVTPGGRVTVSNVGSESLQGDAAFCHLLGRMGCQVEQTATATTVTAPADGAVLRAPREDVDMEPMTDAFMTLAAVAAQAQGVTRIVNIANQRVKECNRIEAVRLELAKLGVKCVELDTGIEIHGVGKRLRIDDGLGPVLIDCRDDHRLSMSFATLGASLESGTVVVDDRRCVDKTYSEFWDHATQSLGLAHAAASSDLHPAAIEARRSPHRPPTVFIIGMRGAGKSVLGRNAAQLLGRPFLDLDTEFKARHGPIDALVEAHGWPEFRRLELELFEEIATRSERHAHGWVVSCGGGLVETPAAQALLETLPVVVQVDRHIDDIVASLTRSTASPDGSDDSRPEYAAGASLREVYERRAPLFERAANLVLTVLPGDSDVEALGRELAQLISPVPALGEGTFFLSLTFPDLGDVVDQQAPDGSGQSLLKAISRGADALELRIDLMKQPQDHAFVKRQLALLRRAVSLPVIMTARTKEEGGAFPSSEPAALLDVLQLGVRHGCRLVDVEARYERAAIIEPLLKQRERFTAAHRPFDLIVSAHVPNGNGGAESDLVSLYDRCYHDGCADIVKVVVLASCPADALRVMRIGDEFAASLYEHLPQPRLIVLAMGERGKLSRVMNRVLSPVTHPLLPAAAAPGQLSVAAIQQARQLIGLLPTYRFCLFGTPIQLSPSPVMHNAGFEFCHLPHCYDLCETDEVNVLAETIRSPTFGGASVTIPLKTKVLDLLDELSPSVRAIGAVNTIFRRPDGSLFGENTDWIGIRDPLSRVADLSKEVAIVVGAGGTARAAVYALTQMGFSGSRLIIENRTPEKAQALAAEFKCLAGLDQLQGRSIAAVVSTVPGTAELTLPDELLAASQPALVEVAYLPKQTPRTLQAERLGLPLVRGIDMLVAQGVAAFKLWTGHVAFEAMDAAAREYYAKLPAQYD